MLEIRPHEDDRLDIRAAGTLRAHDYDALRPTLRNHVREHGPLRALIDVRGLERVTPGAAWEDTKLMRYRGDFQRIAVVGDRSIERFATALARPFVKGKVMYFDAEDERAARVWLEC